jgi:hypothetical protein
MRGNLLFKASVAASMLAAPLAAARADLVLFNPAAVTIGGTGLGAVNTVLTIQANGNVTTETGCVSFTAGGDVLGASTNAAGVCSGTGDDKTGASQTQTRLLSETGVTTGTNFAILFNPAEPGSGNSLTLNTLVASFYNATTGAFVFQAAYTGAPHNFVAIDQGTGNTGYEFTLNTTEAAQLQTFITALGVSNIRVGLSSSAGVPLPVHGGNETYFVFNSGLATVTPEPSTTALMATGLFALVGVVRRRRRS